MRAAPPESTAPADRKASANNIGRRHLARYGQNEREIAVRRKNWTFCGSDSGGHRTAAMFTLIETCKLNDVDARSWLADVLARIADHPASKIADLLP